MTLIAENLRNPAPDARIRGLLHSFAPEDSSFSPIVRYLIQGMDAPF